MRKRLFPLTAAAILATGVIAVLTAKPLPLLSDGLMALLAIHAFLSAWQLRRLDKAAVKRAIPVAALKTLLPAVYQVLGLALVATVALVIIGLTHAAASPLLVAASLLIEYAVAFGFAASPTPDPEQ